jgi:hypothetical protein
MFSHDATPFQVPKSFNLRPLARLRDDYGPPRVIIGPPIGDGRVAFVEPRDAPRAPAAGPAPEVLLSLFGQRPGGEGDELLLRTAVRRCDLWNGDFDERLKALVLWTGWAVTRIERRELAATPV